jgi:hypothetical protein
MEIPKELKNDIWDYCRNNNITNIDEFSLKLLKQGFTIEKFGATPIQKTIEVEKIVEKIIEKPVEKIVEVPVEKIVEKEVVVTDNSQIKELADKINELQDKLLEQQTEAKSRIRDLQINLDAKSKELEVSQKLLAEEKNKHKKDLYGEG